MKVLMINSVCGIKSTGRICTDLANVLEKNGHEVKIAYGRERVPKEFEKYAIRIGSDTGIKMHAIKARLFDKSGFGSLFSTLIFISWVKKYNPDIIHLHNIHGYYINIKVLFDFLKNEYKGRVIWTLHDCWAFTGHTPYCDSIDCERWKTGCYKCPLLGTYPKAYKDNSKKNWKIKNEIFNGVKDMIIVTPSQWLCNLVKQSFLHKYETRVINNGIDTEKFFQMESDFKEKNGIENKIMLLSVATSWDDMKGYSDFIEFSKMIDNRYKLVLVGLTKQQLNELPCNIIGIEKTSSILELVSIYNAADVYLNFSYCENYPTVNIESMACGTPVLTYNTGGSTEIVKKYGGIIVNKGNLDEALIELNNIDKIHDFEKEVNDNEYMLMQYSKIMNLK